MISLFGYKIHFWLNDYIFQTEGVKKKISILENVVTACPGLVVAVLALAKSYAFCDNYLAAMELVKRLLHNIEPSNADAHLILAQIHVAQVCIGDTLK